jgi:A/G-specific adenine glycosylase
VGSFILAFLCVLRVSDDAMSIVILRAAPFVRASRRISLVFLCVLRLSSVPSELNLLTFSIAPLVAKKCENTRRMKMQLSGRALKNYQTRMLAWFRAHQRDLPWRRSRDPYRIWVAEVMLQQTRIATVTPYYHRFLARFPTVQTLARSPEPEVLKLWSGLGYYSRARNLHRAAKIIVAQHKGQFPRDLATTLELPGIGVYTAAAVLSIAYDVPLAVLDGNVARVLARIRAIRGDLRAPKNWRVLTAAAQSFLASQAPGDWNQSLMELGEVICTPQSPRCAECPVERHCRAYAQGLTGEIPAPRRKRAAVHMKIAAAILRDPRGRTLLVQDPGAHDTVLFSRMWQFPALEVTRQPKAELEAHLSETLCLTKISLEALPIARHGVTFRNITLLPFIAHVSELPKLPRTRILPLKNLSKLPISSATRKIAAATLTPPHPMTR